MVWEWLNYTATAFILFCQSGRIKNLPRLHQPATTDDGELSWLSLTTAVAPVPVVLSQATVDK